MDQGVVVTVGTPSEVLEHPEVIESYLGSSAAAINRSGADRRPPETSPVS
jgi:branched-chain amino acid transport system ATP-binding protein